LSHCILLKGRGESHLLCLCRLVFSYEILTPAALNFFVSYADGAVESLWSIDQYFEFVLVLMLSTGLSFQVGLLAHVCVSVHVPPQARPFYVKLVLQV
jgi:Sec-independent protein secretion pathway component TatC